MRGNRKFCREKKLSVAKKVTNALSAKGAWEKHSHSHSHSRDLTHRIKYSIDQERVPNSRRLIECVPWRLETGVLKQVMPPERLREQSRYRSPNAAPVKYANDMKSR